MTVRTLLAFPTEPGLQADGRSPHVSSSIRGGCFIYSLILDFAGFLDPSIPMWHRSRAILALLSLATACTPPRSSGPPSAGPPIPTELPPPEPGSTPPPSPTVFKFHFGTHRYAVITDALIRDHATPNLEHHVRTHVVHTIQVDTSTNASSLLTSGVIDSLSIEHSPALPSAPMLPVPLSWGNASTAEPTDCTLRSELISQARQLLPRIERSIHWADTVTIPICRPGIHAHSRTIAHYRLIGPSLFRGDSVLHITRTSETEIIPETRHPTTIRGVGRSTAQIYLDTRVGSLAGLLEEAQLEVTVFLASGDRRFTQQTRSQIVRLK